MPLADTPSIRQIISGVEKVATKSSNSNGSDMHKSALALDNLQPTKTDSPLKNATASAAAKDIA